MSIKMHLGEMCKELRKQTYDSLHAPTFDKISDKVPDIATRRKVDHSPFVNTACSNKPLRNRISNVMC
jgi:hypothetical protein